MAEPGGLLQPLFRALALRQQTETNDTKFKRKKCFCSLRITQLFMQKNPKDPTKMQLKQSDFNKVTNLNAKSVVFLGNSNKLQNFKISFAIM